MEFHQAETSHFWRVAAHNMISEFRTTFVQKRDKKISFLTLHYYIFARNYVCSNTKDIQMFYVKNLKKKIKNETNQLEKLCFFNQNHQ